MKSDCTSNENQGLFDSLKSKGRSAMKYTAGAIAGIGLMAGTAHSALIGYADITASYDKDTNTIDIILVNQGEGYANDEMIDLLRFKTIDDIKIEDYVTSLDSPTRWDSTVENGVYRSEAKNIDFAIGQTENGFWYFTGKDNLLGLLKPDKSEIEIEYQDSSNYLKKGTVYIDNIPHGNGPNPVPAPSTAYTFIGGLILSAFFYRKRRENNS